MSKTPRREFVKQTGLGLASAATMVVARNVHGGAAQTKLAVALIGCGGQGKNVASRLNEISDVELRACCDPNEARLAAAVKQFGINKNYAVADMRKLLEDESIDAVVVATPDHWHAPAAILACDAGKHVYVEKPCSHNVREGRLLVEAARRNNRVVQHGTQVRSTPMIMEAVKQLHNGVIGDVKVAKAWNIQRRGNIGHPQHTEVPTGLDFDLWVGPTEMVPYRENLISGNWHWFYHFGTGDMGNDGVHDIDYVRWGLGVDTHPTYVSASGGKYFFNDDQEFPDTQQVTFEYPGDGNVGNQKMLIYEQRLWSTNYPGVYNVDSGGEFYGTKGRMFLSRRGKIQVLDAGNKRIDLGITPTPQDISLNALNFVESIRLEKRPNADIEFGHLSSSLCHLGNLATRFRRSLVVDPQAETIVNDAEANILLARKYRRHWAVPENS